MTIRWGIVGCGDVCEVKSGPPLYKVPGSELRIVMRRDAALARDFATRHGVPFHTTNAREVIEHPEVDAVYVATPPDSHLEYALRVADARKPCYVEKPMARTAGECATMVAAFAAVERPLFVAYYRRALPRFIKAASLIQSGELGRLMAVQYLYQGERRDRTPTVGRKSWREDARVAGGGLFLDLGSHVIDILDFLLGPLSEVAGHATRRGNSSPIPEANVEDTVTMSFVSAHGVIGTCTFAFHTTRFIDRLALIGRDGTLEMSVFGKEPLQLTTPRGQEAIPVAHPEHVQYPLMEAIISELTGGAARCPSTGDTAIRTSRVMDRVLSTYYAGRDDAFWERPLTWQQPRGEYGLGTWPGS